MQQIGRYEILEEIGRGAMGVVFKGRDPLIGRAVAVKTITSGVAESADLLERFYREARAAGGLQHPNIVTIYEMAESAGSPFIAMEYLEGESLEKLIARRPVLPVATKLGYIIQACRALDFAHRRGVIHRDVKPANIVVTRDGVVKVVDFGIARIADTSKTQTGTLLGTLAYMSPEQLRGQQTDASCDIWAMGIVLYELLAHQRPFSGDNHAAVLLSILQDEPKPIRELLRECPPSLQNVLARALRKNEKERYLTMADLLKDLEAVSASLEREGSPAAVSKPVPRFPSEPARPAPSNIPQKPAATERIDMRALSRPGQTQAPTPRASFIRAPILGASRVATPPPKPTPSPQPTPEDWMAPARTPFLSKKRAMYAALAIVLLIAVGAIRQHLIIAAAERLAAQPPAPPAAPLAPSPTTSTTGQGEIPQPTPASASVPAVPPSLEEKQRHLIDSAHAAADAHDFKAAQARLDEAVKLNGPLNSLAADLHRQFSEEAYGAEMQKAASQEQALWQQGVADLQASRLDDAEKSFRNVLVLPAGGPHWAEAERYVDEVIPQRRLEQQLWAEAQIESASTERGHLLKEIKTLDEVMAGGGVHEQQARQRRDAIIRQMVRENARRNGVVDPTLSEGYEGQLAQLETEFGNLALKGDAAALEGLQELRPKFKALADAGGPLAMDARDYLNSVIPKTQKQIEDNLAEQTSDLAANAEYERAVKDYDRAVATQNTALLRGRVLAEFQQIEQSGGIRAKEAERYLRVLIPAALKKSSPEMKATASQDQP